jgi:hypothetical protein
MTQADEVDQVVDEDVELVEAMLGYAIVVHGEEIGSIEGVLGSLEYLVIEPHWQAKGPGGPRSERSSSAVVAPTTTVS